MLRFGSGMQRLGHVASHVVAASAGAAESGPPPDWPALVKAARESGTGFTAPMIYPWNPAREELVRAALGDSGDTSEPQGEVTGERRFMHTWSRLDVAELQTMCELKSLPTDGSESASELIRKLEDMMIYKNPGISKGAPLLPRDPRFTTTGGSAMQHFPHIVGKASSEAPEIAKMESNESERNSQTWLEDLATSAVPGRELTSGLFRMNEGEALEYTYTYEEVKYIVEGEFHLTDGTGQKVVAVAGDIMYFPKGSAITFDTPSTALGYFCGQRRFGEEETDPAEAEAMAQANPPMVHYSHALATKQPVMEDDESQRDSATWFGDVAGSTIGGKEMASGFFEMHAGNALECAARRSPPARRHPPPAARMQLERNRMHTLR